MTTTFNYAVPSVLLGLVCFVAGANAAALLTQTARPADSFVDAIGVNTHLGYYDTIYKEFDNIIKPRLLELGVRHIRDGTFNDDVAEKYLDLGKHGIKVLLITNSRRAVTNAMRIAPALFALEGVNEPDTRGTDWPERTRAEQRALYEAVKGNPATARFPVLVSSLANIRDNPAKLGPLTEHLDFGNFHPYAAGQPPSKHWGWGTTMQRAIAEARRVSENKPLIATECGYHNRVEETGHPGCSEIAAAKYFPRLLAVYFNAGLTRFYTYEFADEKPDPGFTDKEQHFGLIRRDSTPKPAYVAIKRLLALLKDPGPPFAPGKLAFSLEGANPDIQHLLLQKRDGRFFLLLWHDAVSYDLKTRQDVVVQPVPVTLRLQEPFSAVVHRPTPDNYPVETRPSATEHLLQVPDELLVIALKKP